MKLYLYSLRKFKSFNSNSVTVKVFYMSVAVSAVCGITVSWGMAQREDRYNKKGFLMRFKG